jgi:hypothetical protein
VRITCAVDERGDVQFAGPQLSEGSVGALLALTACKPALDVWSMRILGTAAALTMFLYLAGFFFRAPHLGAEWYAHEGNSGTLALLVAGFCMLPVVAGFTCRLKSARSGAEGED